MDNLNIGIATKRDFAVMQTLKDLTEGMYKHVIKRLYISPYMARLELIDGTTISWHSDIRHDGWCGLSFDYIHVHEAYLANGMPCKYQESRYKTLSYFEGLDELKSTLVAKYLFPLYLETRSAELKKASAPLVDYLCKWGNPHMKVIVDNCNAELVSGEAYATFPIPD